MYPLPEVHFQLQLPHPFCHSILEIRILKYSDHHYIDFLPLTLDWDCSRETKPTFVLKN
jgi:hypothetical protein